MIYKCTKHKIIRSATSPGDHPVKMYVRVSQLGDEPGVATTSLCLSEENIDGWERIKIYRNKALYKTETHVKFTTLMNVLSALEELADEIKNS